MSGLSFPLPPSFSVPEFGRLFRGLGRDASYDAAERGEIPTFQHGRSRRVSTYAGLAHLGWPDHLIAQALGITTPEHTEAGSSREPATATVHVLTTKTTGELHGAPPTAG